MSSAALPPLPSRMSYVVEEFNRAQTLAQKNSSIARSFLSSQFSSSSMRRTSSGTSKSVQRSFLQDLTPLHRPPRRLTSSPRSEVKACVAHLVPRHPPFAHPCLQSLLRQLMAGLEFNIPSDPICALASSFDTSKVVPDKLALRVQDRCYEKGLMLLTTSIYQVIRFIPALIVTEEQMATALRILKESVEEIALEG